MRIRNFIELVDDPNFISGIHNYCDRWCERCPFTARCRVYAAEEADSDVNSRSRDISNAAFWQKIASIFEETRQMITAWAEENGVDLSPSVLAEIGEERERGHEAARNHPLARAAEQYAHAVNHWFENDFQQMEVFSDAATGSNENEPDEDVNDYVEVIRWYQFFIAAKMIRGLLSRIEEDEDPDDDLHDSDGSVKAALIAMDRSIGAWKLMGESRESADSTHKFLIDLEKLRLGTEQEFPRARDFIRPGFDEDLDRLH